MYIGINKNKIFKEEKGVNENILKEMVLRTAAKGIHAVAENSVEPRCFWLVYEPEIPEVLKEMKK